MLLQSEEEVAAMKKLGEVHKQILDWGLLSNQNELVQAIHVIQGFVVQHTLQRVSPEEYGRWYTNKDG